MNKLKVKSGTKQVKWLGALLVATMFLCLIPVAGAADGGLEEIGNFGFVPNSGEASVSKVDLKNYGEVARYYTAPRVGDMVNLVGETASTANTITPYSWRTSRIAMDAEGNAWVINTGADAPVGTNLQGSIVRIQADTTELTSTNNDPANPLAFGTDEAVQVFPVGVQGDMPRAIAIDSEGYIWVGFYSGGQLIKYEYNEAAETLTPVGEPFYPLDNEDNKYIRYYEMKFAPDGTLFISSRSSTPARTPIQTGIWAFNPTTDPTTESFSRESTWNSPYTILIDDDGTVYATAYNNLLYIRTGTGTWTSVTITGSSENRGMGFDNAGNIWIASTVSTSGGTVVYQYNPEKKAVGPNYVLTSGRTPVGVGKDGAGNMWVVCRSDAMSQGWIEGFDPATVNKVGAIQVGYRPYAYGDFTQYKLQELAALGDFVWEDMNGNGIQDTGEPGIADVTVELYDCDGNLIDSTTTDTEGYYEFTGLAPGEYSVKFVTPMGYYFTMMDAGSDDAVDSDADTTTGMTACVTLTSGQTDNTIDAGMYQPATLGDFVWEDMNGNGIQDTDEPGIADVTVKLYACDGTTVLATTTTNADGYYEFTGLAPGEYSVKFVTPTGYYFTMINAGSDGAVDSDADATTGMTACVTLTSGQTDNTIDAGMYQPATLGDFVWNDMDRDGIQDAGEHGVAGVTVELYACGGTTALATITTDADGYYEFTGLEPGEYSVKFVLPEGVYFSLQNVDDDALDSDADPATGMTTCTDLESGETDLTWDAGMYRFMYETAYAMGSPATCFSPIFANWGWTNLISATGTQTWNLYAGAGQCDETKGTLVGTVTVEYEAGTVSVNYNVVAPYSLEETHVYAGADKFPMKKGVPTVAPGAYYNNGGFTGTVYVIAHAVVGIPDPDFGLQA